MQKCPLPKENGTYPEVKLCRWSLTGIQNRPCGPLLCSKNSTFHCIFRILEPYGPFLAMWNSHYSSVFSITFVNWCVPWSNVFQPWLTCPLLNSHYSSVFSITFANWCPGGIKKECSVSRTKAWVATSGLWMGPSWLSVPPRAALGAQN